LSGFFASGAARLNSSSGTFLSSFSRRETGRRCTTGVPAPARSGMSKRASGAPPAARLSCAARLSDPGFVARDREAEAVLEIEPADFAVGYDVEADAFLQCHVLPYTVELDPGEIGLRGRALLHPGARGLPPRRAKQAADHVGADAIELSHA
jgi:hypothetical protein